MKILYFNCAMGAAGDMLAAALLELHPEPAAFLKKLNAALPAGVTVWAERDEKRGIVGTHFHVDVHGEEEGHGDGHHHHPHTSVAEILARIEALDAPEQVKKDAAAVYRRIAEAESQVHGTPVENIHLHELGSLDALADVLGVCWLLHELAPERIVCSPIAVGSGTVKCAHGVLPVPAPATALLLRGLPIEGGSEKGELCTPTGAALLGYFAAGFGPIPAMRLLKSGVGTGTKDFASPNILRALWGESGEERESILELSCNLDDNTPEEIGFAMERLFEGGALDVFTTPIGMKKNRPGIMLTVLCKQERREELLRCLFRHTGTLGVRETAHPRYTLRRDFRTVETEAGPVRVKTAEGFGVSREKPEFEDLAAVARRLGISLREAAALLEERF
ncbi:MAG: nickel pincer cofactor biosynthesis protein LarC [Oscillospiraceae bacterium]|nr:nickel pincer cofactor biosynthesis protein LarC [Oscillospiraceae bacterium]